MAEEKKVEEASSNIEVKEPIKEEVTYTEAEQSAINQGWKPKDQWQGAEDEWIPAKAFLKNGELIARERAAKQDASQKEKVIKAMKEFHLKVKEDAKKEVFDTLRKQKRDAIKQEDFPRVAELDLQLEELQSNLDRKFQTHDAAIKQVEAQNVAPAPEFVDWSARNPWYVPGGTTGLTAEADTLGVAYAQRNPNKSPTEILDYVEKTIKKMYPEQFRNKARDEPPVVDAGGEIEPRRPVGRPKTQLTEMEKQVAANFGMTEAEYAAESKKWDNKRGNA